MQSDKKDMQRKSKEVYTLIFEISKRYDSQCFICHKSMKSAKSGFTIHHLEYRWGEKTHKDFTSREKYYAYLTPIIDQYPDAFMFLCNACHQSLDGPRGLNRRKKENVLRLFLAVMNSKGKLK